MSNSQPNDQDELQKYLEEKAKQEQEKEQEEKSKTLSAYEGCVLRESDKVRELIAEAQRDAERNYLNK